MKYIVFPVIILFISFSCKKKTRDLLDISFRYSTKYDFTLPKMTDVEVPVTSDTPVPVITPDITNTIPDEFSKNNININKVKSVVVEGLNLNIKTPPGQTFSFVKSIKVYLGAKGLGEQLVAFKDNIHLIVPSPTSLSLDPSGTDIAAYIKGPTYYLKIETVLVKTTTTDIVIESEINILAVANPLN